MFDNIGEKIKSLAIICTCIGFVCSLIAAIVFWADAKVFAGFAILILGFLASWVGSFLLYGFGELIIQTTNIANGNLRMQMLEINKSTEETNDKKSKITEEIQTEILNDYENNTYKYINEEDKVNIAQEDECPCCFSKIKPEDTECSYCGYKLK